MTEQPLENNLYDAAQSRELDRTAIEDYGHTGLSLMKVAGNRAFANIARKFPEVRTLVVLCGSGNNGGDGYVVAECARSIGIRVVVIQASAPGSPECRAVCAEYLDKGGVVSDDVPCELETPLLVVDGLLGTGIDRAPGGRYGELIEWANTSGHPVLALDVPSGLNGDTGMAYDPCIRARMTITFISRKLGQFTGQGKNVCGEIRLESLNIERDVYRQVEPAARLISRPALPARPADSHKGHYGNVVIAGGAPGMLGATILAGSAALRCGSGLVTILSTGDHVDKPALRFPELMTQSLEDQEGFQSLMDRCNTIVLGPGLGRCQWSEALFQRIIGQNVPMVVDADGLNLLALSPSTRDDWVLTPHPGEAATLLGVDTARIQEDRPSAARDIAEKYGGVCVLKGAGTLVVDSSGELYVCDCGNPGMASAGMGDVLSGIIGSLVGQGMPLADAATAGTWLHSTAADLLAERVPLASMIASDVVKALPKVLELS